MMKKTGDAQLISVQAGDKIKCACGKEVPVESLNRKASLGKDCPNCHQPL